MPEKRTHQACFGHFGVVPRNPRWSWSGIAPDGARVAVTLWQDRFTEGGRVYSDWLDDIPGAWTSRPGFTELVANLAHARDHLDGIVHIILAKARDPDARPRLIERCFPQEKLRTRMTMLDETSGRFRLERVEC